MIFKSTIYCLIKLQPSASAPCSSRLPTANLRARRSSPAGRAGRQRGSSEAGRGLRHSPGSPPHTWVKFPQDGVWGAECASPGSRERARCARPSGESGLRSRSARPRPAGSLARPLAGSPAPPRSSALPIRPPGLARTPQRRRRSQLLPRSPGASASASARATGHMGGSRHVTPERRASSVPAPVLFCF